MKLNRIATMSCGTTTCGSWLCAVAASVLIGGLADGLGCQAGSGDGGGANCVEEGTEFQYFQSRDTDVNELWEELAETLSGVRRSCGEICVTEAGRERVRKELGVWSAELEKEVDCAALFANEDIDADSKFPVPPYKVRVISIAFMAFCLHIQGVPMNTENHSLYVFCMYYFEAELPEMSTYVSSLGGHAVCTVVEELYYRKEGLNSSSSKTYDGTIVYLFTY